MDIVVACIAGYFLGSIPFGLIIGRQAKGVDLRRYGSGKTGFTNSLRVLGLKRSLPVFLGDFGKGMVATLLPLLYSDDPWARTAGGVAATAGHVWPLFAGFRGGRGVLTGAGALVGLNPIALAVAPVVILVALTSRFMSAASISGVVAAALLLLLLASVGWTEWAYAAGAFLGGGLIIALHKDNIRRLLNGTEPKIGRGGAQLQGVRETPPSSA